MSDAKTHAYAASAEALAQNLLAYGAELLGLDPATETLALHSIEPFRVELTTGLDRPFPLMTVSLKPWRRRGPGSTTEIMVRGLTRLARTRVWRRHGTTAPPFGLLKVNVLLKAIVQRSRVDPQSFFDAVWSPVEMGEKHADSADWMTPGTAPTLLARSPAATHPVVVAPHGLPWLSGYSTYDAVHVEAWALDDRIVLVHRPQDNDRFELRIPADLPLALIQGLVGKPLRSLISHPILDEYDMVIDSFVRHEKTIRFRIRNWLFWNTDEFRGGSEARREVNRELRGMRQGRAKLEELIARHLTIPGATGDVDVPWIREDLIDPDDGFDLFADKPWTERKEFEGIMSKRRTRDTRFDDGDPLITFDEDDPEAYL